MIVHVIARLSSIENDIVVLRRITQIIHELGHSIARDWIEPAYRRAKDPSKNREQLDWEFIYQDNLEAIDKCDILIAEESGYSSFGVGYIIALALQKKKPTLSLSREIIKTGTMSDGIKTPLFIKREYNNKNLKKIVERFINDNTVRSKDLRFNFVVDRAINNHLRWLSFKYGKTKAEVLRQLLLDDIKKDIS